MAAEDYDVVMSPPKLDNSDNPDPFERGYGYSPQYWILQCIRVFCLIAIYGGIFTNIFAFVVLVKSRLWLKHEGYVYLAANLCVNVAVLAFCTSTYWIVVARGVKRYPADGSNFMCKIWHFLMSVVFAPGWLSVALLFSVYLREHLTHRRRCGCPIFAAKYCTLFSSKIIVGLIFGLLFICGVPYLAVFEINPNVGLCHPAQIIALILTLLSESILMGAVPFIVLLIVLLMMLCTKREGDSFGFSQIEERTASDEQMRVMAVTLSSMTLFSQCVMVVFHMFLPIFHYGSAVVILTHGLSLGLQPILCFIILKELREGLRSRCCRRPSQPLDGDVGVIQLRTIRTDPPRTTEA